MILGWDGNYGLTFTTTRPSSRLGLKLALGADWRLRPRWRTYGELGLAYRMRSDGQEHVRLQGGVEYEGRPKVLGGRMAWFGATDFSSLGERGWRLAGRQSVSSHSTRKPAFCWGSGSIHRSVVAPRLW